LSRKLGIRNAHNEHLVYSDLIHYLKPPRRDGIRERRMRKAKPRRSRRNRLRRANRRDAERPRAAARADTPRENNDAIGDAARRKHVNAVTAFKYPPERTKSRCHLHSGGGGGGREEVAQLGVLEVVEGTENVGQIHRKSAELGSPFECASGRDAGSLLLILAGMRELPVTRAVRKWELS